MPNPLPAAATAPAVASATIAMLLADSRLPAGAHVSSNSLEAALRDGLAPSDVGDYLATRMRTVVPVEAGTAVLARRIRFGTVGVDELAALERLRAEWAARTPSRAQREVAEALGDGLRRLADVLWPGAVPPPSRRETPWPRPLVLGLVAVAAGLDGEDLVRLVAYDDAQTVAAALLKLEPGDPRTAASLVLAACALLEPRVAELAALEDPARIPCSGAPLTEGWAEAQSTLPRRLFRA
ncbi:urease accessory protein UreF [Brachybacterium fresconis]|uniref:Urease accessory protein n=1 Tax=Brachybacterium fresconis TaxID=173363 RepID=A0ABS4YNJ6_9MICO|nr:urease accessory UreF family protein [Brachybacterium fresconis]MBP2410364.1 urease accessory protein [Brachybacterium fresconis]